MQKWADECGLVAEVLKHAPDFFIDTLSAQYLMRTGQVPADWRKTSFNMLPKTMRAEVPSKYRPIATIRLSYKFFVLHDFNFLTQLEIHQQNNNMVFGAADVLKNI